MADKKQPRSILTEEDYTSTLSHIITRDFYPSIYSLRRDDAILEARGRGDIASAVSIRRAARRDELERERESAEEEHEEQHATSSSVETSIVPAHNRENGRVRKRPRPLKHESITGFHARVTSEDNAEFESNQERESREREENMGLIFEASADKAGRLMIQSGVDMNKNMGEYRDEQPSSIARALLGCETPLGLASDLYNASPSAGLRITEQNNKTSGLQRNGVFFQPQHRSANTNQSGKLLLKEAPSAPSGGTFLALTNNASDNSAEKLNKHQNDNLQMPPPPARTNQPYTHQLVEYLSKPAVPNINPPATRFAYQNESRLLPNNPNSLYHARNQNINGFHTDTSDTTDLDASPRSLHLERAARKDARAREHETFVDMTPLIQPGSGGRGEGNAEPSEPIMTWGDVASTPLVIGDGSAVDQHAGSAEWEPVRPSSLAESLGNDDEISLPTFDVVDVHDREVTARRVEKNLMERTKAYRSAGSSVQREKRSYRDKSKKTANNSRTILDRTASLTPAARALFEANISARRGMGNGKSSSRIFQSSSISSSSSKHAGSIDAFGSTLRMAYTPNTAPNKDGKRSKTSGGSGPSSYLRAAVGEATPRCQSRR